MSYKGPDLDGLVAYSPVLDIVIESGARRGFPGHKGLQEKFLEADSAHKLRGPGETPFEYSHGGADCVGSPYYIQGCFVHAVSPSLLYDKPKALSDNK